ncbi:MAG TPA: DUF3551 domain-containing protein [Xanthobacteraceae bacterium]|jgi:hypothetical protein|nr:DUF3551 domain-containing protein [Xanthobacteraceae bacterium]
MTGLKATLVAAGACVAMMSFAATPSYAWGDAPWCAVVNTGKGVVWDCQYQTVEQCVPNVIAGNRGFCNLNPDPRPTPVAKSHRYRRHSSTAAK